MTLTISIPDEQVIALTEMAAAQGLTLERWFQKMAEQEAGHHGARKEQTERAASVVDEMRDIRSRVQPDPEDWTVRDYVDFGRR
jgi:membrane protein implicated in regulation of membrane protease activity